MKDFYIIFYINYTYRISSNKHRASNKRRPLIKAALLGIHIKISASLLISAALLNTALY